MLTYSLPHFTFSPIIISLYLFLIFPVQTDAFIFNHWLIIKWPHETYKKKEMTNNSCFTHTAGIFDFLLLTDIKWQILSVSKDSLFSLASITLYCVFSAICCVPSTCNTQVYNFHHFPLTISITVSLNTSYLVQFPLARS